MVPRTIAKESNLIMKLIVGSEAVFFLSLIMAFVYFTYTPGLNPQAVQSLNLTTTGLFTGLLLFSSFTFWRAEVSFKQGRPAQLRGWLLATLVLGLFFLIGQGFEYGHLFREQITVSKGTFSTSFFTLTGFHGLHVLVGLIILGIVLYLAVLGDFDSPGSSVINSVGIYWHFVDIVWLVVFVLVYVLPHVLNLDRS